MNKTIIKATISFSLLVMGLAGCGGGGGGGGSGAASTVDPFINWSTIDSPTTVKIDGISQDATYTATAPDFDVTSVTDNGFSAASSATIKYNTDGEIVLITITTPFSSVTWDEIRGDIIESSAEVVTMSDFSESSLGILINAADPTLGWEYQTFGVWQTGRGTEGGTVGAITVGAPTTGSAIPTLPGTVTFTGLTSGTYLDATGTNEYLTVSPLTAYVDFQDREIIFTTQYTEKITTDGVLSPASNLDMTGILIYEEGINSFTGSVSAEGLSGTSTGQFYGPAAEELGGVFKLSATALESLERYSGAYGAKR